MTDATDSARPVANPWVLGIAPYVAGRAMSADGRRLVKLSANENPLGVSPKAQEAWEAASSDLTSYPDAGASALREAIAAKFRLDPARIIHGAGSDELLHLIAKTFAGPGDECIYMRYGFMSYDIAIRAAGATPVVVADKDYGTDVDGILAAVTDKTKLIYLANPNNPTGTFVNRKELARLHAGLPNRVLFVLDQAYSEYLDPGEDDGGLDLVQRADNVILCRTFSKIYGLAAARVGWAYASADIIGAIQRIRPPFNVTTAAQAAATAGVTDDDFIAASRAHNRQWREWLTTETALLGNYGVRPIPSKGNFLMVEFSGALAAERVYQALEAEGYLTRYLPGLGLINTLRISIGREEDMRRVVEIIRALVA